MCGWAKPASSLGSWSVREPGGCVDLGQQGCSGFMWIQGWWTGTSWTHVDMRAVGRAVLETPEALGPVPSVLTLGVPFSLPSPFSLCCLSGRPRLRS